MNPFKDIASAKAAIEEFDGSPEEFGLPISDELHDPMGLNLAILTDYVLAKDWEPDGFEQKAGYRVYRYKPINNA